MKNKYHNPKTERLVTFKQLLNSAFKTFDKVGIVARQDFACCLICGNREITNCFISDSVGYTFYHIQDREDLEYDEIYLAYGAWGGDYEKSKQVGLVIQKHLENCGLKDGLSFVFDWYIGILRRWWRKNILRKEYCSRHGLYCEDEKCEYKHYKKFPKYPEIEIWDWCIYCGEASASKVIWNPNTLYKNSKDGLWWKVCDDCDEMIEAQDQLGMAISFGDVAMKHGFADKAEPHLREQINEAKSKIQKIEKRTGKPSITIQFTKTESGYESRKL